MRYLKRDNDIINEKIKITSLNARRREFNDF